MSVTIKDVAREAGVSVATVSRVLNGSAAVSEDTAENVNEVISRLGYSPNCLGRNLRKRETRNILVIVPYIGHSLYSDIIKGIQDEASNEYDILVAAGYSTVEIELRLLGMLTNHSVDAAVILGSRVDAQTLDPLADRYNIALCAENIEGSHTLTIMIDNRKAAKEVADRFIAAGKKRIGFVTTDDSIIAPSSTDRLAGYIASLTEHGIPIRNEYIFKRDYDYKSGIQAAHDMMKLPEPPEAVLCISDLLAAGFIKGCNEIGAKVPDDVEVCGFDNISLCEMYTPMITTVSQPAYLMGRTTARRLIDSLKTGIRSYGIEYLDYDVIVRESASI